MSAVTKIYDSPQAKEYRKKIQAQRIKRLGWNDHVFHYVMNGLGYGTSLRELDEDRLRELWQMIRNYKRNNRPDEFKYDRQGRYMYKLQREAGWSEREIQAYLVINYKKTHWNLLSGVERAEVIRVLQAIIKGKEIES